MDSGNIRYVDYSLGGDLIKSMSITIGGDSEPQWYCAQCKYFKSETEQVPGTVCKQELKEFSYELFRKYWRKERDKDISNDDIDKLAYEWIEFIEDDYDV